MNQPLFHSQEEFIEKTAGEVDLPDDPNQWAQSILQELYKQVPYITDYQPHVQMEKVDGERGYGLGHVEIQNQTEAPNDTDPAMLEATGIRTIRLPFIVKEKKLSPFDLLVNDDGQMIPLTENRIRQALFRPQAFDVTSRTPGDQSMIGQLYPPYRQNGGFGGGGVTMGAGSMGKEGSALESFLSPELQKEAMPAPKGIPAPDPAAVEAQMTERYGAGNWSAIKNQDDHASATADQVRMLEASNAAEATKKASILRAVLPTATTADHSRFTDELSKHASYLFSVNKYSCQDFNGILTRVVDAVPEQIKEGSWKAWVKPTVAQVRSTREGYVVKTASHHMWEPETELLSRGDVVTRYGVKVAMEADTSGAVTVAEGADAVGEEKEINLNPVEAPGLYKVTDNQGREHVGMVVPQVVDLDGELTPLAIFTNGTVVAVQSEVFGEPAGDASNLPSGPVGKNGAFYTTTEEGIRMTIPFEFNDSYEMEDQPKVFSGVSFDGRPVEVSVQPNIQDITPVDEKRILIPEDWLWLPMDGVEGISLVGTEEAQAGNLGEKAACVRVISDGTSFSFKGTPLLKIANDQKNWLNLDDAMFLLSGLGVDQEHGATKLAEAAAFRKEASVMVGRIIEPRSELMKEAQAKARDMVHTLSSFKQPMLLKEAATFPDPTMVDAVLSLGFINPENIMTFVSYLPDLEDVQTKLCELLFSVRLGLKNLPQASLERAVRSLEETIEGLKVLGFQGS